MERPPAAYVDIGQSRGEMQQELARLRTEIRDLRAADAENKETIRALREALEHGVAVGAIGYGATRRAIER